LIKNFEKIFKKRTQNAFLCVYKDRGGKRSESILKIIGRLFYFGLNGFLFAIFFAIMDLQERKKAVHVRFPNLIDD